VNNELSNVVVYLEHVDLDAGAEAALVARRPARGNP